MFEQQGERRERRIRESQARAKAEGTRRALLGLLRDGPMSRSELQARLVGNAPLSVVNYHLTVLLDAGAVVNEDGLYRLA